MKEEDSNASSGNMANNAREGSTPTSSPQAFFSATSLPSWTDVLPKTDHVRFFLQSDFGSLGPIADWGPALRYSITMLFADSRVACLYMGPDRVCAYNEKAIEMLGGAHPGAMGTPLRLVFPTIWDSIGVIIDKAASTGQAQDVNSIPLSLVRHGFLEEAYFVGSYIPLLGDTGVREHFYNSVSECTTQVLYERRRKIVERLASIPPCSVDDTLGHVTEILKENPREVTMAMLYSFEELETAGSGKIRLRGSINIPDNLPCAPTTADLNSDGAGILTHFRKVKETGSPVILSQTDGSLQATGDLFSGIEWGGFGEPSRDVVILPLSTGGKVLGFYVQGMNPRRPYDTTTHMSVVDLARQIEAKWGSSISVEEAKLREEMLERQLTDSERRLRHMAQSAPLGMVQINLKSGGTIEWANDQFYEITGHPRSQPSIADFINTAVAPEDRERAAADLDLSLQEGATRVGSELRLIRKWTPPVTEDGDVVESPAWILTTGYPVLQNNQPTLLMGFISDISHQKWAESVQTRNAAAAVLAKRRQEEFIDVTSHEMRNPLNAILQLADSISKSLDLPNLSQEAYRDAAIASVESSNIILACSSHLQRVIDDVLILSRLESHMLSITPVVASPSMVLESTVQMFRSEAFLHDIKIEVLEEILPNSEPFSHVLCDTSRLAQVLINLISNAIKFTASQQTREIKILHGARWERPLVVKTKHGDLQWTTFRSEPQVNSALPSLKDGEIPLYLYFCVQDTGPGVTLEEIEKLFKRFSQANSRTHIKYGGSGLGLYICRELAEKQGGGVGVASRPGEGSAFGFYIETRIVDSDAQPKDVEPHAAPSVLQRLPQRLAADRQKSNSVLEAASKPSSRQDEAQPAFGGIHVLVVEDNLVNQKILAKQLRKAGCAVSVANNGSEALELLTSTDCWCKDERQSMEAPLHLDAILMDWEMPVMNGLECSKRIRELEEEGRLTRRLPIIATTANVREEQRMSALAAGMDSVLPKPFTVGELLLHVQERLSKHVE